MNIKNGPRLAIFLAIFYCTTFVKAEDLSSVPDLPEFLTNLIEDRELSQYEAPEIIKKLYTTYWAGNDEENRPIWVGELGKWDIRRAVEQGGEFFLAFDRYIDQLSQTIVQSMVNNSTPDMPVTETIGIIDMEGYNMYQLSSVKTVSYILRKVRQLEPIMRHMETGYIINTNYVAEMMVNLVRPILGKIMERVEIHGVNKAKWMPRLMKKLPKDAIPEWYGGKTGFRPIQVYG